MSHRRIVDKFIATACISMFTLSLYFWYLFLVGSDTDPDAPPPAKTSGVYVSAEKIGMLFLHDIELSSFFQKAIPQSVLLMVS